MGCGNDARKYDIAALRSSHRRISMQRLIIELPDTSSAILWQFGRAHQVSLTLVHNICSDLAVATSLVVSTTIMSRLFRTTTLHSHHRHPLCSYLQVSNFIITASRASTKFCGNGLFEKTVSPTTKSHDCKSRRKAHRGRWDALDLLCWSYLPESAIVFLFFVVAHCVAGISEPVNEAPLPRIPTTQYCRQNFHGLQGLDLTFEWTRSRTEWWWRWT